MTGREKFSRYNFVINSLVSFFKLFGKRGNTFFLLFFRNTSGTIGILLRYIFVKNIARKTGNNLAVYPGVYLFNLQNVEFGDNVSIHPMCYIEGLGGVYIGNDVSVAHSSTLISTNHSWDNLDLPIKYNPATFGKIVIENDVWVGCGVRILAGVKIYKRSVIAAGAVVNKSFEEHSLIGGVPAKILKKI